MATTHIEPVTMEQIKERLALFEKADVDAANAIRAGIHMFQLYDDWIEQQEGAKRLVMAGKIVRRRVEALGKRCASMCAELDELITMAEWVAETCGVLAEGGGVQT